MKTILINCLNILIFLNISLANIIKVPSDTSSIQDAIDISSKGDTILIDTGVYHENILVEYKSITIGSRYLITNDTSFISKTVIDGGGKGRVVHLRSPINLCGVTIANGYSQSSGGGIKCEFGSGSVFRNLIVKDNISEQSGGGLLVHNDDVQLKNCVFENNQSGYNGGGVYFGNSNSTIDNILIQNNFARVGGGLASVRNDRSLYSNLVIKDNRASKTGGGLFIDDANPSFNIDDRISVFNNIAPTGADITINNYDPISVAVDTFTIFPAKSNILNIWNPEIFSFDVLNTKLTAINHDIYVNPEGSDLNSGKTFDNPIKTIFHALRIISADSTNVRNIYLSKGEYSVSQNDEVFPIYLLPYISIEGEDDKETLIKGMDGKTAIKIKDSKLSYLKNLMVEGAGVAIECNNSSIELSNLRIQNNNFVSLIFDNSSALIKRSIVAHNSHIRGEEIIRSLSSNLHFQNCTLSGNTGFTLLLGLNNSNISFLNSILWNRTSREIQMDYFSNGSVQIANSNINNGLLGIRNYSDSVEVNLFGENLNTNPIFRDSVNIDFRLLENSPCIDTGIQDTMFIYNNDTIFIPSMDYIGAAPDMGVFEFGDPLLLEHYEFESPNRFSLWHNFPNPFNPSTMITFNLPTAELVKIQVYNSLGQVVHNLVENRLRAGSHEVEFNGTNLPSGMYFYRLQAGEFVDVKKMLLIK